MTPDSPNNLITPYRRKHFARAIIRACSRTDSVCVLRCVLVTCTLLAALASGWCRADEIGSGINEKEATPLRHFTFESGDDEDYDGHPDDWSRRTGDGFPTYVRTAIDRTVASEGAQSLRFDLNGARAAIYSPPLLIDRQYSLFVRGTIRTKGLQYSAAAISVSLLDHRRRRLSRVISRPVSGTHNNFVEVRLGPIHPDSQARFAVIGCHILDADRSDITGAAWFDDIWIGRLPRMTVVLKPDRHILTSGAGFDVESTIFGLEPSYAYDLALKMVDLEGREDVQPTKSLPASGERPSLVTHAWTIPPQSLGYHRMVIELRRAGRQILSRDSAFAVVEETERGEHGEFGWSLPRGFDGLTPATVGELSRRAHLHHLKLPLWSAAEQETPGSVSATTQLLDLLEQNRVHVVGLLNDPPPSLRAKFVDRTPPVSKILSLPQSFWSPSLEPLIVRYAFRVKEWQLGDEDDAGFAGLAQLPEVVEGVRKEFDRIGRNTKIVLPWPGDQPYPPYLPADAVRLSKPVKALTSTSTFRPVNDPTSRQSRLHVTAASAGSGSDVQRASDLALTVLKAKLDGAASITYTDPLDPARGLFRRDGAPTELFLPWRQLSSMLGGAEYLGQILMPKRAQNAVFRRGSEVFVMLWSNEPVRESFNFGYEVRAHDLWGRTLPTRLDAESGQSEFDVGPTPILLRHCAAGIVGWYLAVQFEQGRLRSEYGQHSEALLGVNPFGQGVSGKVVLRMPVDWEIEPSQWELQAAAGERWRLPMLITFPPNGTLGEFHPEVDFTLSADRNYRFTVHLPYTLGLEDFDLDLAFRRLNDGRLEVEQRIVNRTKPLEMLDFDCHLFVPGQVRQRLSVPKLGSGEDRRIYVLPNADKLKGQELWLRCEQVDGRRVLNLRKKVEF